MRETIERNIGTLEHIDLLFSTYGMMNDERFEDIMPEILIRKGERLIFSKEILREFELIAEALKGRDEYIKNIMGIMEERFEKVWNMPWPLMQIIHKYTWKWEDLLRINSKVLIPYFALS